MREIKFRAWVKHERQMLYRTIWDRNWYATPKNDEGGCHCVRGISPDDKPEMELMQFTGLKDKNGKEIYEGDIVKYGYEDFEEEKTIHQVVWCRDDYPAFDLKPYLDVEANGLFHAMNDGEIEVIGNIYENPELLKASQ